MIGRGNPGRHAYACSCHRHRGDAGCTNSTLVPKDYIEQEILDLIRTRYNDERIHELVELANDRAREDSKALRDAIAGVKRRIAGLDRQLNNVRMAPREGRFAALASEEVEAIQREKTRALAELQALQDTLARMKPYPADDLRALILRFHELAAKATREELKQYVRYFVRRLVFDPENNEVLVEFVEDPFTSGTRLKALYDSHPTGSPWCNSGGVGGGT